MNAMSIKASALMIAALGAILNQANARPLTALVGEPITRSIAQSAAGPDTTNTKDPTTSAATASVQPPAQEAATPIYKLVAPETVRSALERWSSQAQWVFGPEFYTLPVDVSVVVSADLGSDYKAAVRQLLDSTQGTAQPMQPCFYSNQVLRVVARHELCARY